ncbi:MAG: hypothetical protein ACI4UV_16910 [Victivallales bacterium]
MNFFSQAFTARYYNADDMNEKVVNKVTDPIFWKCKPTKRTIEDSNGNKIDLYIYDFAILTLDTDSKGVISENDPYSPYRIKYFHFVKEDDRIKLKYAVASDRKEDSSKSDRASNWITELLKEPEKLPDDLTATVILDNICNVTVYFNGSAPSSPTVDQSGVLTVAFSVVDADTVTRLKAMGKSLADAYSEYSAGNDTVAAGLIAGSIQTFQVTVKLE